jgi:hypothetical protein
VELINVECGKSHAASLSGEFLTAEWSVPSGLYSIKGLPNSTFRVEAPEGKTCPLKVR